MTLFKKGRFIYWLFRDLLIKYTRSLIAGFIIGFVFSIFFIRTFPYIRSYFTSPIEYIGVIGEYSPSTLPISIQKKISIGLTSIEEGGRIIPALAESWESTNSGKTYYFKIKHNNYWQNDKEITAFDINYNIKNVKFSVIDKYTIKAELDSPYGPFPSLLAKPVFLSGLIGIGNTKIDSIKLNGDKIDNLKLIQNNNEIKNIYYRFYKTELLALTAFKLGEIDKIIDLSSLNNIDKLGNINIQKQTLYNRIITLFLNNSNQFLAEKKHRQALGYAIPDFDSYEKADSPISNKSWAYNPKIRKFNYNPKQFEKLIDKELLGTDSSKLTITTFSNYLDIANQIADSWTKLGIKTNVKVVNSLPSDYQVLLSAFDIPPDPDQYIFWHSTQTTNITNYINVKIDKLLEDGRIESEVSKRKEIYADFQKYLVDDAPAIFLFYPENFTIYR